MLLKILKSKIHRATVTESNIYYTGSITIDAALMDAVGILPGECVLVADITNGTRHETYVIPGERDSGTVCINGAAAKIVDIGDVVIIMAFAYVDHDQARQVKPRILLVDQDNRPLRELD